MFTACCDVSNISLYNTFHVSNYCYSAVSIEGLWQRSGRYIRNCLICKINYESNYCSYFYNLPNIISNEFNLFDCLRVTCATVIKTNSRLCKTFLNLKTRIERGTAQSNDVEFTVTHQKIRKEGELIKQ